MMNAALHGHHAAPAACVAASVASHPDDARTWRTGAALMMLLLATLLAIGVGISVPRIGPPRPVPTDAGIAG